MARLPARLRPVWPLAKRTHVLATGALAPLTSRWTRQGPRGVARTAEEAGRWEPAVPAHRVVRTLPEGLPAGHWRFAAEREVEVPRVVTMELPGGRVLAPSGAVLNADGLLVWSASSYFGVDRPTRHPAFLPARLPPVHEVDGRLGVLACRGDGNYYHFLLDVLPRLGVLDRSPGTAPVDRWLVPQAARFQRELLELAGVTGEVVDSARHPHVRAEVLVVPELADPALNVAPWVVPFLRGLLVREPAAGPARRVYVTRGQRPSTRRVVNEQEVLAALVPLGFEVVDTAALSVADQVALFSSAERVVAPHGAALANLVFAPPGCEVVELFAPDYVNPCYWGLAEQVPGLRYRYLVGAGARGRRERAQQGVTTDVTVDVEALRRLLDR